MPSIPSFIAVLLQQHRQLQATPGTPIATGLAAPAANRVAAAAVAAPTGVPRSPAPSTAGSESAVLSPALRMTFQGQQPLGGQPHPPSHAQTSSASTDVKSNLSVAPDPSKEEAAAAAVAAVAIGRPPPARPSSTTAPSKRATGRIPTAKALARQRQQQVRESVAEAARIAAEVQQLLAAGL